MITIEKIARLREQMKRLNLAAFIIPSSDPHFKEYVVLIEKAANGFPVLQDLQVPL